MGKAEPARRDADIWSVCVHPKNPRILYAGATPPGVYRSEDGGDTWRKMADPGLPHDRVIMAFPCRVMRLAVDPNSPDDVYATLEANGMMRSRNRGETWEDFTADLIRFCEEPKYRSRIGSQTEIEGMLDGHALAVSGAAPGTVFLANRMGLFRSDDRGETWKDMEISRFSPLTYGRDIRVSPHDPKVMYACLSPAARSTDGAIYRTDDVGQTWKRFDHGVKAEATMMAVTVHPRDPNQVYGVSRFGQVFGTQDGGRTWTRASAAGRRSRSLRGRLRLKRAEPQPPEAPSPRCGERVGREGPCEAENVNSMKQKLAAGELVLCMNLRLARTVDIAMVAKAGGYDALYVDMQHAPYSIETTSTICAAALGLGITPLVRVPSHDGQWMSRVLDGGAQGVIVPDVESRGAGRGGRAQLPLSAGRAGVR